MKRRENRKRDAFSFSVGRAAVPNLKSLSFHSRSSSLRQTHMDFPNFCFVVVVLGFGLKCCYLVFRKFQGNYTDCNLRTVGLVFLIWLLSGPSYSPVSAALLSPWLSLLSSLWPDLTWERRHSRNSNPALLFHSIVSLASSLPLASAIFLKSYMSFVPWIQYLPCTSVLVPRFLSHYQGLSSCLRNLPGVPKSSKDT